MNAISSFKCKHLLSPFGNSKKKKKNSLLAKRVYICTLEILDFYIYAYPIPISYVHKKKVVSRILFFKPYKRKKNRYSNLQRVFCTWLYYLEKKVKL